MYIKFFLTHSIQQTETMKMPRLPPFIVQLQRHAPMTCQITKSSLHWLQNNIINHKHANQ